MSSSCPSTLEYVCFHARCAPDETAVIYHDRSLTYGQLYQQSLQMVEALVALGVKEGDLVAVEDHQFVLHLVLLLALDELGATSLSYLDQEVEQIERGLKACDWILCASDTQIKANSVDVACHLLTPVWLETVFARRPDVTRTLKIHDPMAPLRLVKSSGTTGQVKFMIHSRAVRMNRVRLTQMRRSFSKDSRFLVLMSFSVEGLYQQVITVLQSGGCLIKVPRGKTVDALKTYHVSDILVLPLVLRPLLDHCEREGVTSRHVTLDCIGGRVDPDLRRRALGRFAKAVNEMYGSNEVGSASLVREDGAVLPLPGVRLEVVNEADDPVVGQLGLLRIKCDGQIGEYWQDPETTAQKFQDGWFYPGDLAVLSGDGTLKLQGRADDLLNINGLKISPVDLEQDLKEKLGFDDVCLVQRVGPSQEIGLWLFYSASKQESPEALEKRIDDILPQSLRPINVQKVSAFARTQTGKIKRQDLK